MTVHAEDRSSDRAQNRVTTPYHPDTGVGGMNAMNTMATAPPTCADCSFDPARPSARTTSRRLLEAERERPPGLRFRVTSLYPRNAHGPAYDEAVRRSHEAGAAPGPGGHAGTPGLHVDGAVGSGPVPRGTRTAGRFDAFRVLATGPDVFELRRTRTGGLSFD
ncbi:hypothetical protein [Streptomyces sp. MH13]|uniref:mycothiol-dependent nitroreductase Rv2466c family protein n=1 Tax=Streptomyces sp. MH13 TaxID=3417651 RepID=UPI003CF46BFC